MHYKKEAAARVAHAKMREELHPLGGWEWVDSSGELWYRQAVLEKGVMKVWDIPGGVEGERLSPMPLPDGAPRDVGEFVHVSAEFATRTGLVREALRFHDDEEQEARPNKNE